MIKPHTGYVEVFTHMRDVLMPETWFGWGRLAQHLYHPLSLVSLFYKMDTYITFGTK